MLGPEIYLPLLFCEKNKRKKSYRGNKTIGGHRQQDNSQMNLSFSFFPPLFSSCCLLLLSLLHLFPFQTQCLLFSSGTSGHFECWGNKFWSGGASYRQRSGEQNHLLQWSGGVASPLGINSKISFPFVEPTRRRVSSKFMDRPRMHYEVL